MASSGTRGSRLGRELVRPTATTTWRRARSRGTALTVCEEFGSPVRR